MTLILSGKITQNKEVAVVDLRIDKGSRAVRCVIACSGGTIHNTVTS